MLGNEPEWLKEKRVRDHEENPAFWYRRYTEEEIAQAENLFKLGKSYKEIAEILNRSELSVKWLLRNRGYSYKMPQYWKSNEFKYLRENYQDMTYAEIGEELGRTEKAVAYQAQKLGYQKRLIKKNSNGDNNE